MACALDAVLPRWSETSRTIRTLRVAFDGLMRSDIDTSPVLVAPCLYASGALPPFTVT